MGNKLLIRPNPYYDESLLGYVIRLCEVNGYESPSFVLKLMEDFHVRYSSALHEAFYQDLASFSKLLQKDFLTARFLLNSHLNNCDARQIGHIFKPKLVQRFYSKFCPYCLKENKYHRVMWDLNLITVCPIHKCFLVSECPQCNQKISIYRNQVCKCKCGFDLSAIEDLTSVPNAELRVAGHIYRQLGIENFNPFQISTHNPLINFSTKDFSDFINYFSIRVLTLFKLNSYPNDNTHNIHNNHKAVCKALSIFDDFPKNYIEFISEQSSSSKLSECYNYDSFSKYHPSIHHIISKTAWTFLYKVFIEKRDYIFKKPEINYKRRSNNPTDRHIPVSQAEKYLKLSKDEFKYLLYSKQIEKQFLDYNQRKTWLIESEQFVKLKSEKETWIKDNDLANQLAIPTEIVKRLAHQNHISVRTKYCVNKKEKYSFDGDLFLQLLSKIRSNVKIIEKTNKDELLNLEQIEKLLNFDVEQISNFLGLCLKGQIKPIQELLAEKGLKRFLFSRKDIEKFIIV